MQESVYTVLPYPFAEIAEAHALPPLDGDHIIERLLEDITGLAGVIATASQQDEAEEADVRYAARLLGELTKATLALWWQWQEQEEAREGQAPRAPQPLSGAEA
jgi:hypothetical protein